MPAVHMKVVDSADGTPVTGAFILFHASAREGTITGHGGRGVLLFAAEAVTGDSGAFEIARQEFGTQPFFLNTVFENPEMVIFKPGYAALILRNERRIIAEREDMTTWMLDGQTVKLIRAAKEKDVVDAADWAAGHAQRSIDPRNCAWKKIPRFLVAMDRAASDWEAKRHSRTDELRFRSIPNPLRMIFMNEELFAQNGCGSPKAFFEPYLR
jgi:hypothetical protein